jgi:hypothetical protein
MTTATTTGPLAQLQASLPKTTEDWLLFIIPLVGGLAGLDWGGLIPGISGVIFGLTIASLSKTLIGLGQNFHPSNWEDALSFIITFAGFLGTAFSANPDLLTWGLIIGFFVKALGIIQAGLNIEDIILAIGTIIAGIAQLTGKPEIVTAALIIAAIGKALPSIGTGGTPSVATVTTAPTSPPTA